MLIGKVSLDNILFISQLMAEIGVGLGTGGGVGGAKLLFECDFGLSYRRQSQFCERGRGNSQPSNGEDLTQSVFFEFPDEELPKRFLGSSLSTQPGPAVWSSVWCAMEH